MSFASFPLDKIGLSQHQLAACKRAGLETASDVLYPSAAELNRRLKFFKLDGVYDLVQAVSKGIVPRSNTVSALLGSSTSNGHVDGDHSGETGGEEGHEVSEGLPANGREASAMSKEKGKSKDNAGTDKRKSAIVEEWEAVNKVGTGDPDFDLALGGGLRVGTITEIAGESAAGKSHLSLLFALTAQLPSLTTNPGGAIILTSEREISTSRLLEMSQDLLDRHDTTGSLSVNSLLDNIHTNISKDIEVLEHALSFQLPLMLQSKRNATHSPLMGEIPALDTPTTSINGVSSGVVDTNHNGGRRKHGDLPIRLLIVDSITALVRGGDQLYANSSAAGLSLRSKHLCSVADKLKALAVEYELAVVIINQVSDVFAKAPPFLPQSSASSPGPQNNQHQVRAPPSSLRYSSSLPSQYYNDYPEPPMIYSTQAKWFSGQNENLQKEASLGIVWANAVNTRIMLSRTGRRRLLQESDLSKISRKRIREMQEARLDEHPGSTRSGNGVSNGRNGPPSANGDDDIRPMLIRRMHVVFSPFTPPNTVDYVITEDGPRSLPDSYMLYDPASSSKKRRHAIRQEFVAMDQAVDEADRDKTENGEAAGTHLHEDEVGSIGGDEYGEEIFDDLGDLPPEFWEGKWEEPPQIRVTHDEQAEAG